LLFGAAVSVCLIGGSVVLAFEIYHVNQAWFFFAWSSIFMITVESPPFPRVTVPDCGRGFKGITLSKAVPPAPSRRWDGQPFERAEDGGGKERRNNLDVRYQIVRGPVDWDLEGMWQTGRVGGEQTRAWAVGSVGGYTFEHARWSPRIGLQLDLASGDRRRGDGTIGTFNPLFPNAYYFTLMSTPTYANLIHLRPSLELRPVQNLKLIARVGLQWRQTTEDAVYVIPNRPVAGTAGMPGRWTGIYEQLRAEWQINRNWAAAVEGVQYQVGDVIRRAGGINANYVNVELRFGW